MIQNPSQKKSKLSFITEINTKSRNTIYCDEKRIEQVFLNLIKNSMDFVPEKGGEIIFKGMMKKNIKKK